MASQQLRKLIDQILTDTSNDMREQCNTVNTEFAKRIEEMNDAKTKMENHLCKVRNKSWEVVLCITDLHPILSYTGRPKKNSP